METMHAAGRRRLPPVPRVRSESVAPTPTTAAAPQDEATERFEMDPPTGEQQLVRPRRRRPSATKPVPPTAPEAGSGEEAAGPGLDAAQRFVAHLRGTAADFAEAAGAASAVVREAVPPARHRRARCRLVLRYADGTETDTTFLGPTGSPSGSPSRHGFDRQIRRWLGAGPTVDTACLVADPEAPGGLAVDLSAWVASA